MEFQYSLRNFSNPFKRFIAAFVLVLGIGYFTGLLFVNQTESTSPGGVVENYNGNEELCSDCGKIPDNMIRKDLVKSMCIGCNNIDNVLE